MQPDEVIRLTELEGAHWWYAERRSILRRILRGLPHGGIAVDIGAAGGGNTRVLHDAGWRAFALEFDESAANVAKRRGIEVARADAHRLPLGSASVDLVIAFDILEHLAEDRVAASEIHRVLKRSGCVVIAVPADPRLWSAHDQAVGHFRRYTREELVDVLTAGGLVIDRIWSWNVLLRPLVAWSRRSGTGSDLASVHPLLNAVLRAVAASERVLPVGWAPGVSLFVIGRSSRD